MTAFTTIADWIKEREAASKKSGSLLITVFGDVVAPHGGAIALGSLVDAGGLAGISEQTIRSSVNRLITDGWLSSEAQGRRSIYRYSESGAKRDRLAQPRIYQNANDMWDGEWHVVVANNWSSDPELYAQYVRELMWTGFGKVSENVFIRPRMDDKSMCCNRELSEAIAPSSICFMAETARCVTQEPLIDLIKRTWDLDTIKSRYEVFIDRYEPLLAAVWKNPRLPGAQAFAIRLFMMHDFRRVRLVDPMLPSTLLPDSWNGDQAFYVAHELYDLLIPSSEQYVMEYMQGPEGRIPYLESWFYDRFGGLTRP